MEEEPTGGSHPRIAAKHHIIQTTKKSFISKTTPNHLSKKVLICHSNECFCDVERSQATWPEISSDSFQKKVADLLNPQEQTYHVINIDTVEGDQLTFHGEESLDTRILESRPNNSNHFEWMIHGKEY